MSEELVEHAAAYLNAGLSVIALSGKMPNGKVHAHGLNEAISGTIEPHNHESKFVLSTCPGCDDRKLLHAAFHHLDTTGIGIPIPEHLVVVDIDGEEGAEQFRDLVGEAWDEALQTPAAKTGRGLHLWYVTPRAQRSVKLGPKLDLKGVGGYVAAPPSLHPDGHRYEWLWPLVGDGMIRDIEWLPAGIERALVAADELRSEFHVERPVYTQYQLSLQDGAWRLRREVVPPPIDGLVRAVAEGAEGNRNNILAWAALQARDEGVTLEVSMRDLGGAAIAAGLTEREVRTTIRSAYRRRAK